MKRLFLLFLIAASSVSAFALSYNEARKRAWFITDKMAYELNLTNEQFDRAYEINLDYLLSVNTARDCFGPYWTFRNTDMRSILYDWQFSLYSSLDYFFRPLRWAQAAWHFPIFSRYSNNAYYFGKPTIYVSYKGRPWINRRPHDVSPYRPVRPYAGVGMRDRYDDDYNKNHRPGVRPEKPGYRFETVKPAKPQPGFKPQQGNNRPNGDLRPGNNNRPDRNYKQGSSVNKRPSSNVRPGRNSNPGEVSPQQSGSKKQSTPSKSGNKKSGNSGRSFGR